MSKRSGFAVKITAFIEAGRAVNEMLLGAEAMRKAVIALSELGFTEVELHNRFMLSREVPDEPKAAHEGLPTAEDVRGILAPAPRLDIPPQLDRRPK